MSTFFLLGIALASFLLVWLGGRLLLRLDTKALGPAFRSALEVLGATALLWALNVALCAAAALLTRRVGATFVSLYLSGDVTLLAAALLEALVLDAWRRHSSASS
jgi:hypothetical protein